MILLNSLNHMKSCKDLTRHLTKFAFSALFLAVLCIFFLDQLTAQFFAQENVIPFREFARKITDIGLSEHYFIGSLFLYCYFRWLAPHMRLWQRYSTRAQFLRVWALNFFVALIVSGILVHIFKFSVGRLRPHKTEPLFDPLVFQPLTTHWDFHSFPSGHSQTMATVATMMCLAFPKLRWFWILAAAAICFTRVVSHAHFLADTIFGAFIGYAGAMISLYLMRTRTKSGL